MTGHVAGEMEAVPRVSRHPDGPRSPVRAFFQILAWDRPDRFATDFTTAAFEAFRDRVAPLLAGAPPCGPRASQPLPAPLVDAERERGEQALRLVGFDPAMAARSLLTVLEAGETNPGPVLTALTGGEPR